MRMLIGVATAVALIGGTADAASVRVDAKTVTVCPGGDARPDFDAPTCQSLPYWEVDPQGRQLWVRAIVPVPAERLHRDLPMGVFVSAKAATEVFLNGVRLGQNGEPAADRALEIPGRMDAVFPAPARALRSGPNEIVLRMSSHHGFLRFGWPVHYLALGEYADPTRLLLGAYWPSLIPFGALLAGALTFAVAGFVSGWRRQAVLLGLLSSFAAGQLFVEVSRGLWAYPYPMHEWRMLLLAALSLGFGICLATQIVWTFIERRRLAAVGVIGTVTVAAMLSVEGYDSKAGAAVLLPAVIGAGIATYAASRRVPQAIVYAVALAAFSGSILVFTNLFLDTVFFYEVAALVLVIMVMQTLTRERDRMALAEERARGRQLAAALEQASMPSTSTVRVTSAGAIDVIESADIVFCKGAGDYVELHLSDGRQMLHHGALARIEDELPAVFLRVHRSYLVNTNFVRTLRREASGIGALILKDGTEVPVSRRVMPKVRSALA